MIERYRKPVISAIWSDEYKLRLWQASEFAAIQAQQELGRFPQGTSYEVALVLEASPIDIDWWLKEDEKIHHDLIAFLNERRRFLPQNLQKFWHKNMTSFDTEEPAFGKMLVESIAVVETKVKALLETLRVLSLKHRYTLMLARTHGQGGEGQSFGKMVLTWHTELRTAWELLQLSSNYSLKFSKMSGAAGNYGGLDPEVEKRALGILGFKPLYGATQVMPRILYAPIAQGLANLATVLHKIGLDIRLKARSPRPLLQEPFKKTQKGSSAMPHKKNTIRTEQLEGMARLAKSFASAIADGIETWEERAIEQSCVERVAWPDLFHVIVHSLEVLTGVVSKMPVYADNMLAELVETCGCYAAAEAKEKLKELGESFGLTAQDAYDIVQLAAFNAFEPTPEAREIRQQIPESLLDAGILLDEMKMCPERQRQTIETIIADGALHTSPELSSDEATVARWNGMLLAIFEKPEACQSWNEVFDPEELLRHEHVLFENAFGV